MKKLISRLFILNSLISTAQSNDNCFAEAKMKNEINLSNLFMKPVNVGDSIDDDKLLAIFKATQDGVVGCKYPSSSLIDINGKVIDIDKIKTNYTIINLNYLYGNPLQQLAELDSLKKELKNKLTIICFFAHSKKDIKDITAKYNSIEFIADADEYIKFHNLGLGTPTTFILDKTKTVMFVTSGSSPNAGVLYNRLKPFLK